MITVLPERRGTAAAISELVRECRKRAWSEPTLQVASGKQIRGLKVRYPSGGAEWKDRTYTFSATSSGSKLMTQP